VEAGGLSSSSSFAGGREGIDDKIEMWGSVSDMDFRVAKSHRTAYFEVIFRKRAQSLVATLRRETCNICHPMGLCHPAEGI